MIGKYPRTAAAVLSLSALAFAGRALHEGYSNEAIIPIPGDRPTVGLGSTFRDDGTPVQMGDKITPPQAIRRAVRHMGGDEKRFKQCLGEGAELYQYEYDAYMNLSYNVGYGNVCKSSIITKINGKQYEAACNTILDFYKASGKDCRVRANNCYGVWLDRLETNKLCLTGVYPASWGAQ